MAARKTARLCEMWLYAQAGSSKHEARLSPALATVSLINPSRSISFFPDIQKCKCSALVAALFVVVSLSFLVADLVFLVEGAASLLVGVFLPGFMVLVPFLGVDLPSSSSSSLFLFVSAAFLLLGSVRIEPCREELKSNTHCSLSLSHLAHVSFLEYVQSCLWQ